MNNIHFVFDLEELLAFRGKPLPLEVAARAYKTSPMAKLWNAGYRIGWLRPGAEVAEYVARGERPALPRELLADVPFADGAVVYFKPVADDTPGAVATGVSWVPHVLYKLLLTVEALDDIEVCRRCLEVASGRRFANSSQRFFLELLTAAYGDDIDSLSRSRLVLENYRAGSSIARFRAICQKRVRRAERRRR